MHRHSPLATLANSGATEKFQKFSPFWGDAQALLSGGAEQRVPPPGVEVCPPPSFSFIDQNGLSLSDHRPSDRHPPSPPLLLQEHLGLEVIQLLAGLVVNSNGNLPSSIVVDQVLPRVLCRGPRRRSGDHLEDRVVDDLFWNPGVLK